MDSVTQSSANGLSKVDEYIHDDKLDIAEFALEEIIKRDRRCQPAYVKQARVYMQREKWKEAEGVVDKLIYEQGCAEGRQLAIRLYFQKYLAAANHKDEYWAKHRLAKRLSLTPEGRERGEISDVFEHLRTVVKKDPSKLDEAVDMAMILDKYPEWKWTLSLDALVSYVRQRIEYRQIKKKKLVALADKR